MPAGFATRLPARRADQGALHAALAQLAEQDPLINLRQDDARQELSVSLYGEVQKEVIQATLADEFGIAVGFRQTTVICIERLAGRGAAVDRIGDPDNPFLATVGHAAGPDERAAAGGHPCVRAGPAFPARGARGPARAPAARTVPAERRTRGARDLRVRVRY